MADADVPAERNGAPLAARPEAEPSAVERASSAAEPEGPESIAFAAVPPVEVVPASSDEPGPPPAVARSAAGRGGGARVGPSACARH